MRPSVACIVLTLVLRCSLCAGQNTNPEALKFDRVTDVAVAGVLDNQQWRKSPGVHIWRHEGMLTLIAIGQAVVPEGKDPAAGQAQAELDARQKLAAFVQGVVTKHTENKKTVETSGDGVARLSSEEASSFTSTSTTVTLDKAVMLGAWGTSDACLVVYRLDRPGAAPPPAAEKSSQSATQSDNLKTVFAKGIGNDSSGNKAKAYAGAMDAAKRQALENVCRQTVRAVASNKVKDFDSTFESKIYSQVQGQLSAVIVVKEDWDGHNLELTISASVNPVGVMQSLDSSLGLIGNPKVMVLVQEEMNGQANPDAFVSTELNKFLLSRGLEVVDAETVKKIRSDSKHMAALLDTGSSDNKAAAEFAAKMQADQGADVIVLGRLATKTSAGAGGMTSVTGTLSYRIIDAATGSLQATDSAAVSALERDASMGSLAAAKRVMFEEEAADGLPAVYTETVKSLEGQLRRKWAELVTKGRRFNLTLLGCKDSEQSKLFCKLVEGLPLSNSTAASLRYDASSRTAAFDIYWLGDPQVMTEMMSEQIAQDPGVQVLTGVELQSQNNSALVFINNPVVRIELHGTMSPRQKNAVSQLLRKAAPKAKFKGGAIPTMVTGVTDVAELVSTLYQATETADLAGLDKNKIDFEVSDSTGALVITVK